MRTPEQTQQALSGQSYYAIAKATGVSYNAVRNFMLGVSRPSYDTMVKLSEYADVVESGGANNAD